MSLAFPRALAAAPLLALILLAACKDEPQVIVKANADTAFRTSSEGATVTVAEEGRTLELETELPRFATAYPGARLKTQIHDQKSGHGGALLVFETADPVEKVAAFYDARAKEAGVKPAMIVNEEDSAVRIFGGPDGEGRKGGALIAISRSDEGPGTEIVITSGMAPAEIARMERDTDAWKEQVQRPMRLQ